MNHINNEFAINLKIVAFIVEITPVALGRESSSTAILLINEPIPDAVVRTMFAVFNEWSMCQAVGPFINLT